MSLANAATKMVKDDRNPGVQSRSHVLDPQERAILEESVFAAMLYMERRRAERARKRFVLVLIDFDESKIGRREERQIAAFNNALVNAPRETDILGWYIENSLLGLIGTDLGTASNGIVQERLLAKIQKIAEQTLTREKSLNISVSFHFYPQETQDEDGDSSANITLYPELKDKENRNRIPFAIKRVIDILGSAFALVFFAPIFAALAIAIKLTSKGPVLFKQKRLGQHGKPFTVLKFRSMRVDCDAQIHQQYVSQFIAGKTSEESKNGNGKSVFKIQKDPRVTPIGNFMRKTSLDEFPQFWNVLRGDMALVGPRPPLAYEFREYDLWHRRRVLEIKPGITGLWQVEGRSRTCFDDMVRLDLRYARAWSIWLDLKILLRTPAAVITGEGAH